MTKTPTSRATRTPDQVVAQQKAEAARERASKATAALDKFAGKPATDDLAAALDAAKPAGTAVATAPPAAVAMPDGRTPREAYLDEVAPAAIVCRLIKFTPGRSIRHRRRRGRNPGHRRLRRARRSDVSRLAQIQRRCTAGSRHGAPVRRLCAASPEAARRSRTSQVAGGLIRRA